MSASSTVLPIQRVLSPGGVEAWLVEEHSVPLIAVEFSFRGGAAQDEPAQAGTAHLLSALLDEGAGSFDAQAFQERLEDSAVELHFHSGRDSFDGSLKTLAAKRTEAFDLLRLAVNEARLDAEAIERIRAQILARIRRDSTDPSTLAHHAWFAQAFPGHPYGAPVMGTETSVAAISRDDLVAYRDRVFARKNLCIAVVGAISAADLAPMLDQLFGALPAEPRLHDVGDVLPAQIGHTDVVALDIPQTTLVFGRAGIRREDPDYIPAVVMNHTLGGGSFTSRFFIEVREKRGLAYSVYSYLDPMESSGVFAGGLATRNDRAYEAVDLIQSEIRRFAEAGPTDEELSKAKKFLTGSYALNFDSSVKIARGLRQIQFNRLPMSYIGERNALVNAVDAEDIRRTARSILGNGDLLVVAVGKPVRADAGSAEEPQPAE